MIYQYPVRTKKHPQTLVSEALIIPDLGNARIDLTDPKVIDEIKVFGQTRFLELYIDDILETKDENDDDIQDPKSLEFYKSAHSALYIASSLSKIKLKKITGNAVLLIGSGEERSAYFVEDKKLVKKGRELLAVSITLNPLDSAILDQQDSLAPVKITLDNGHTMEPIIKTAYTKAGRKIADPHDQWEVITVSHHSRNRTHCCENLLPKITNSALGLEWAAMIPMTAGTLKITAKKLLPSMSNNTANYTTLASATINSLMMLYIIRTGPGGENQSGIGRSVDSFFHNVKRTLTCKNRPKNDKASDTYHTSNITGWVLKALLTLFTLHFIVTSGAADFEQNLLVTETIEDKDALFAEVGVSITSRIAFIANQITDPLVYLGYWLEAWRTINYLTQPKQHSETQIEDITHETENSETNTREGEQSDLEQGSPGRAINNAELHVKLLEGIASTDRSTTHSPSTFTATRTATTARTSTQEDKKHRCLVM
jgi:hypothetical protein